MAADFFHTLNYCRRKSILLRESLAVLPHLQAHLEEAAVEVVDVEMALAEVRVILKFTALVLPILYLSCFY
jgi:hypothetical protein